MKTVVLLVSLLFAVPALGQTVHTASLESGDTTNFTRAYRGDEEGDGAMRALRRRLRNELLDVGLRGTYNRLRHLRPGVARVLGIAPEDDPASHPDQTFTYHVEGDPFDLSLGVDLCHRHGWSTNLQVDLDDRLIALEFEGQSHVNYGLSYDEERDTLQAMVSLHF